MDAENASTALDIERYVYVLVRQWRVIVAATVVGLLAGVGFVVLAPRQYTATTTVNLTVISTEPFAARSAPSSLLDDQEERAIAQSHLVAERAAETTGGAMTASEIRESSSVATTSGAAVVSVSFTAGSPDQASSGADAVASAYLSYRRDRADERIAILVDGLTKRIDDIEGQVAEIDDTLFALEAGDPAAARHTTERQQMLTELDGLLAERNGLQSVDTTAGYVLSSAADNAMEAAPSTRLSLLTGLAAGVVLGVVAAFLRNPRDRRLRTGNEVARLLGAPVLSQLGGAGEQVPARAEEAAALRVARERLLAGARPGDTVVVMDASHQGHISPTVLNLAVLTAQSGHRVQLIAPEGPQQVRARLSGLLDPGENEAEMLDSSGALQFVSVTDVGDESQRDLLVTQEVAAAIESAGRRTLTLLALTTDAPQASLLAALRVSQAMVLVAREKSTTSTEVSWLRREAGGIGALIIGAIIEGPLRGKGGEGRRTSSHAQRGSSVRRSEPARRLETVHQGDAVPAAS